MKKCVFPRNIVHPDAVVLEAVAYNQIIYMKNNVVAGNLIKDFLTDVNRRSFVFHYDFGRSGSVIDYRIAAA